MYIHDDILTIEPKNNLLRVRSDMSEFDKVIGYEDIKLEMKRFCDVLRNPDKYMRLGVNMPSGLLLAGEPGIGKTLLARCFIHEAGCKVITLRKEKPDGDFVKEIKESFEKAKKERTAIVFLDDMDKFANEDEMHRDAEEYVTIQSCIDECKGMGIFALATVNDRYCLPDSLLRAGRFDKIIEVTAPRGDDARNIIEHFLESKEVMGNIDVEEISRLMEGHSCAELETVINEAGIYAAYDGREKINQNDLIKASLRIMFESPECIESSDDKLTSQIAVHEAGHAVVGELLEPGSISLVSVCRYTGSIEGITKGRSDNEMRLSIAQREKSIMQGLGGKAAVEVVYGVPDVGCESDMHKIFSMISDLVDSNCVYGFDAFERGCDSRYLIENKDRMMASEVSRLYRQSKKLIVENRGFFDNVVEELIEKKTLTFRDMERIRNNNSGSMPRGGSKNAV